MSKKRSRTPRGQVLHLADTWFGDDASMLHVREALQLMASADPKMFHDEDEDDGEQGFPDYNYMLDRHGDLAVLSISGSMVSRESWMNRFFGLTSYQEIRNAAIAAHEGGARAILLDVDTNGGSAEGIGELSDFIADFDRSVIPIYSYTGTKALSAGYWISATGRKLFSSSMALNGSIGVISSHFSYARMLEKQGIDVTMFRAGEFKALGSPYEKLDDKAKAEIEGRMGKFYDQFLSHVSSHRGIPIPALIETAAEGRVFMGHDGLKAGLVDSITSFDKAVAAVLGEVGERRPRVSVPTPSTAHMDADMKRQLNDAGLAAVASGMDQEKALADPKLSEEVKEKTAEELAAEAAAAQAAADAEKAPKAEDQPADKPKAKAKAKVEEEPQPSDQLVDRLITMSADLADAKAEVKRLQASEQERSAHMTTLMKICGDAINRMELPLNRAATNFTGMSAETVINAYHRTLSDFNSKMKIGSQAEVPAENDLGAKPKANGYVPASDCVKL